MCAPAVCSALARALPAAFTHSPTPVRVQRIEFGEEAQRAFAKSSECDLRVADVEATSVRIESAVIGARGEYDKAILAEKTCLMQIIDQLQARTRHLEEAISHGATVVSSAKTAQPGPSGQPLASQGPRPEGFPIGGACRMPLPRPPGVSAADPVTPPPYAHAAAASEQICRARREIESERAALTREREAMARREPTSSFGR